MSTEGFTITEAAKRLGVSTRTVRRFVKAGKINAKLVQGFFGQEYRILELPPNLGKQKATDNTPSQVHSQTPSQLMDIIRELQEKNLSLAAQLGVATERLRVFENEVRLLNTARIPWWKRILKRNH